MIRVLLEELVHGTREIRLAGTPSRIPSHVTAGLSALPVVIEPSE
jgi:hypothetical protein